MVALELAPGTVLFVHPISAANAPELSDLSDAEREVVALVLEGCDNATIASRRGTSIRTTANQVASIFRKTGVRSRAQLAAKICAPKG